MSLGKRRDLLEVTGRMDRFLSISLKLAPDYGVECITVFYTLLGRSFDPCVFVIGLAPENGKIILLNRVEIFLA